MNKVNDKVESTARRAQIALRELIAEGTRISQAAVEKRAGLSNGTLNYNTDSYRDIKRRIHLAKQEASTNLNTAYQKRKVGDLKKQIELKDKYRRERNEAREDLKKLLGERAEIVHHVINMQRYIAHLEESGKASGIVVNLNTHRTNKQSKT